MSILNSKLIENLLTLVWICPFLLILVKSHETDMRKELILSYPEKMAFDKFKSQVWPNVSNAHGFIKTDLFLLRWIRAKHLDVNVAVRDMFDCLEWRRINRMDTIHSENWSDMTTEYPYQMDAIDLQGRPVATGSIGGDWNVRRAALQGKFPRLSRYAFKLVEEVFDRTYQINHKYPNITQFSVIANLGDFNIIQQGCPLCLTLYVQLLSTYNKYYPNFAHKIITINTPSTFNVVLDLIKPMFNKETRDALQFLGYNKKQWKAVLDQEVDERQLLREFGGTKADNDNI